jgi:hypothetical protein
MIVKDSESDEAIVIDEGKPAQEIDKLLHPSGWKKEIDYLFDRAEKQAMLDSADLQRQIPILFREEKELTYADSMKHQKQFIRFLITKLHLVNAMTDDINREFVFD